MSLELLSNILKSLENSAQFSEIDLSNNKITDEGADILANFLSRKHEPFCLNLAGNKITDNGIIRIMKSLEISDSLFQLDISFFGKN